MSVSEKCVFSFMFVIFSNIFSHFSVYIYSLTIFLQEYVYALSHVVTADLELLISRKIYEITLVYVSIYNISRQTF